MSDSEEQIEEARRVVRVTSKGKKTRRIKCRKGFKLNSKGTACVPMSGSEKAQKKRSIKKAIRTKRAKGAGAAKRATRKRLKALKKRKSMGVK